MTYPNLTTWVLAATAAGALLLPGAWILLTLVPVTAILAAACWPRPRHARPTGPPRAPATITQLWLYRDTSGCTGSMDLTAELAWRRRYEIPPELPITTMEAGAGPPLGAPAPRPYLVPFEVRPPGWPREQLERLANTGDHRGLARQLGHAADLEHQDRDTAAYLAGLAARAAEIRQAALEGLQ